MKRRTDEVCEMREVLPSNRKYPIPLSRSTIDGDSSDRRFRRSSVKTLRTTYLLKKRLFCIYKLFRNSRKGLMTSLYIL